MHLHMFLGLQNMHLLYELGPAEHSFVYDLGPKKHAFFIRSRAYRTCIFSYALGPKYFLYASIYTEHF